MIETEHEVWQESERERVEMYRIVEDMFDNMSQIVLLCKIYVKFVKSICKIYVAYVMMNPIQQKGETILPVPARHLLL